MRFTDTGIILSVRKCDEHGALVRVLTREHGVYAGVDRYALSSKRRGIYQPGNIVQVTWQARLSEQLGTFTAELVRSVAAHALDDRLKLAALQSACQLGSALLHDREPQAEMWEAFKLFTEALTMELVTPQQVRDDKFLIAYIFLELTLLRTSGFGLDLSRCAATGAIENLAYISPKSGRAVSAASGEEYKEKLFGLPAFFLNPSQKHNISQQDLHEALRITGYFLQSRALAAVQGKLPQARERLVRGMQRERAEVGLREAI